MIGRTARASADAGVGTGRRQTPAIRRRLLVLHNPVAGSGRARRRLDQVLERLAALDCRVEVRQAGTPAGHRELALAAVGESGLDAVIAAGGDGTVRATASALVGTAMPLGIIPVGTGNVMAHEIGLGSDPDHIARCLAQGRIASVRSAHANGELFFLMAGAGFDGRVIAALDTRLKRRIGKLAYVWPVMRSLGAGIDDLRVRIDGVEHRAGWVVATMRQRYAGAFLLSPEARLQAADVRTVLLRPRGRPSLLRQLIGIGAGMVARQPGIADVPGLDIEIASASPVPVQIDGEPFGTTPIRITAGGPALRLIVPASDTG